MHTFQLVFNGTLSNQDIKKHIPYPVQVPQGTQAMRIRLTYSPEAVEQVNNLLTLTVLDPLGFRGEAHRHQNVLEVSIQESAASPGFFPGPIQPGDWMVLMNTQMVMPGSPLDFELVITGMDQPDPDFLPGPAAQPLARTSRGPGWYRGDFHTHTIHSDGDWDVADLVAFGQANKLDFVTLSDHNTVTGLGQFENACADGLLPICGTELTTFWGHALALGRRAWVDWRIEPGRREMSQIAAEVEAQGGLFVIAHPEAIGDPYCTGCDWRYQDMRPGLARIVEVWNSPWNSESYNEAGLKLACEWMNQGLRMVLTAGSDKHGKPYAAPEIGFNIVYSEDLSEPAILRAVRAGHLYLSNGPTITLTAQAEGQTLMPGDSLLVPDGHLISLAAGWGDCPPDARCELVIDGEPQTAVAGSASSAVWELRGGQHRWALLTLRAPDGEMLALTNPIYYDGR